MTTTIENFFKMDDFARKLILWMAMGFIIPCSFASEEPTPPKLHPLYKCDYKIGKCHVYVPDACLLRRECTVFLDNGHWVTIQGQYGERRMIDMPDRKPTVPWNPKVVSDLEIFGFQYESEVSPSIRRHQPIRSNKSSDKIVFDKCIPLDEKVTVQESMVHVRAKSFEFASTDTCSLGVTSLHLDIPKGEKPPNRLQRQFKDAALGIRGGALKAEEATKRLLEVLPFTGRPIASALLKSFGALSREIQLDTNGESLQYSTHSKISEAARFVYLYASVLLSTLPKKNSLNEGYVGAIENTLNDLEEAFGYTSMKDSGKPKSTSDQNKSSIAGPASRGYEAIMTVLDLALQEMISKSIFRSRSDEIKAVYEIQRLSQRIRKAAEQTDDTDSKVREGTAALIDMWNTKFQNVLLLLRDTLNMDQAGKAPGDKKTICNVISRDPNGTLHLLVSVGQALSDFTQTSVKIPFDTACFERNGNQ